MAMTMVNPLMALVVIGGALAVLCFVLLLFGNNRLPCFACRHPRLIQWLISIGILAVVLAAAVLPFLHPEWGQNMTNISVV